MKNKARTKFPEQLNGVPSNTLKVDVEQLIKRRVCPELLEPWEAAKILRLAGPTTLAVWRYRQNPPLEYVRVGKKILYNLASVLAFIESRTVRPVAVDGK